MMVRHQVAATTFFWKANEEKENIFEAFNRH